MYPECGMSVQRRSALFPAQRGVKLRRAALMRRVSGGHPGMHNVRDCRHRSGVGAGFEHAGIRRSTAGTAEHGSHVRWVAVGGRSWS